MIKLVGLEKQYESPQGRIQVLREISLEVSAGEMVAVMGPSGSGKSTLLFVLGLFLKPSRGSYHFEGDDVLAYDRHAQAAFRRDRVGFVFQTADLLENTTVYENLEFPLIYAGVRRRDRFERISQALEQVNLTHRIRHPANLLSGGERQRVAVARALVNRPRVILADEPTGQLDRDNSDTVMDHFEKIVSYSRTAIVVVTHDGRVAERCHSIQVLENGALREDGTVR
ncbi:ABC transporter ATP-binding protein [Thermodesulfobacteriota bacterium]